MHCQLRPPSASNTSSNQLTRWRLEWSESGKRKDIRQRFSMKKPKPRRRPQTRPRKTKVEKRWKDVDHYFCDNLLTDDPILASALEASDEAGLPAIAVSPNQGKLLQMLAEMIGDRSVLEVGQLGGSRPTELLT